MNRREALRQLGSGATFGALAATALVTVQCAPTEVPAAVHDPMLAHIERCREVIRQIDALTDDSDDAVDAACAPLHNLYDELEHNTPVVTTKAGAIEALRFCHQILHHSNEHFVVPVVGAALAYFDGAQA